VEYQSSFLQSAAEGHKLMVDVSSLNDNCFVVATAAIVDVCDAVKDETGSLPTLENLCEILTWGL